MTGGIGVKKRIWTVVFVLAWLYLFGVIGGIDLAEASGEPVNFVASSLGLLVGLGVVVVSGVFGGLFS